MRLLWSQEGINLAWLFEKIGQRINVYFFCGFSTKQMGCKCRNSLQEKDDYMICNSLVHERTII